MPCRPVLRAALSTLVAIFLPVFFLSPSSSVPQLPGFLRDTKSQETKDKGQERRKMGGGGGWGFVPTSYVQDRITTGVVSRALSTSYLVSTKKDWGFGWTPARRCQPSQLLAKGADEASCCPLLRCGDGDRASVLLPPQPPWVGKGRGRRRYAQLGEGGAREEEQGPPGWRFGTPVCGVRSGWVQRQGSVSQRVDAC